ncbi:hypothetical protein BACCAP_01561 [Pseudoflavonifractor capillosus ATCC 29799]|uniref:Uncharacterized protein n=1 Tax=Pseudoflavonifractor capillosus ATCC 29799 TaxID=411467 RepID=A6NTN2_9FIRM|nr:hypothetical protein BACCAP_01561 [Pseudoflavonifractor capillosus ATCC 29799]
MGDVVQGQFSAASGLFCIFYSPTACTQAEQAGRAPAPGISNKERCSET